MRQKPPDLSVLASLPTEAEAILITQLLESHGIEAKAMGGYICDFRSEASGDVRVIVRTEDLSRARAALEENRTVS